MRVPQRPPEWNEIFGTLTPERMRLVLSNTSPTTSDGQYRHWETLRRTPPPEGLTHEEWWLGTKFARMSMMKPLPLTDADGHHFSYGLPDAALAMLHTIDQRVSGEIGISEAVINAGTRDRYIINSLIEEAITSSQLEGAMTSLVVAKEMIRTGRPPRDNSERMILNNYLAINFVGEHRNAPLTPALVCQIQSIVTDETFDDKDGAGRIQRPDDERVRVATADGLLLHQPPPATELPGRIDDMCRFANGEHNNGGFLHPVVRAIMLHFWLAYDHPFADGNGRTARALFYWSILGQGYWLGEYLSISRILRQAPARYGRSFLYTETDDGDATYFLLYHLKVICRAVDEFYSYLRRKVTEVRDVERLLQSTIDLNHRQLAVLSHALRQPGGSYTFRSHANSHNVVRQSARSDLLNLEARGLLERRRVGKMFVFHAVPELVDRLRGLAEEVD